MKFRSKPVEIEAMQFNGGFSFDEMLVEWGQDFLEVVKYFSNVNYMEIRTLEGTVIARPSDWIIKGTEGEFYPCKDSVFKRKYEAVE